MLKRVFWLKLCGHRRTTVPGDINEQNDTREGGCGFFKLLLTLKGLLQQFLEDVRRRGMLSVASMI